MFSSICGLYPLNVNSNSTPCHNNQKCSQAWSHVHCRAKIAHVVENHRSKSSGRNVLRIYSRRRGLSCSPAPSHQGSPRLFSCRIPQMGSKCQPGLSRVHLGEEEQMEVSSLWVSMICSTWVQDSTRLYLYLTSTRSCPKVRNAVCALKDPPDWLGRWGSLDDIMQWEWTKDSL